MATNIKRLAYNKILIAGQIPDVFMGEILFRNSNHKYALNIQYIVADLISVFHRLFFGIHIYPTDKRGMFVMVVT